ncbi:MAG: HAD family hydrolase [Oscillospiraceae bacterium]
MSTIYISDLDGTLLHNDETLSKYTCRVINALVDNGVNFSFATARSGITSKKVTKGLYCQIPMIVYNGTMVIDSVSNEVLISNFFEKSQTLDIKSTLEYFKIKPIVYSMQNNVEKFTYISNRVNEHMKLFLDTRKGDIRENPIIDEVHLYDGSIFYFTCIDSVEKLKPVYDILKSKYDCIYQRDYYSNSQWLEIVPKNVNKSTAILQLKDFLKCDRVVSFGDGLNDIGMFKVSNESYAVSNAVDEIKSLATGIIGSNEDDGVAKWLENQLLRKFYK